METPMLESETLASPEAEAAEQNFFAQVKSAVLAAIEDAEHDAWLAQEEAKSRKAYAALLKEACAKEQWWLLKGVISNAAIEALCDVSPSNLLEDA
jgi:hypothetical protein